MGNNLMMSDMHEARLYRKTEDGGVQCGLCSHRCAIRNGTHGICGVRENRDGTLYATTYGRVSAEAIDPIEKKPLYHFLPGTLCYSLGSIGCNFHCEHCQNWHISRGDPGGVPLRDLQPGDAVARAMGSGCRSVAWTYNEPTIWHEYPLDMGALAHSSGLSTVYVTNGYITEEGIREISSVLDAFRVDIKSFSDDFYRKVCGARLQPVLDSAVLARELGMHLEIVTLIIPGLNDSREETDGLINWIVENTGPDTPVHFTRFHPDYRMTDREATPVRTLEGIYQRARELGLKYPYLGNVSGHRYENTYCPACGELLISRQGYQTKIGHLNGEACGTCGEKTGIIRQTYGQA
jgi:pyruvate formate lyase activating enzyme